MDTRWNKKSKIYIAVKTVLWLIFLGAAVMALDYLAAIANRGIYMEDYSQSSEGFESDLTFAAQSVVQGIQENDMKQYVNTALVYAQTKDGKTYENEWAFDGQVFTGSQLKTFLEQHDASARPTEGAQSAAVDAAAMKQAAQSDAQDGAEDVQNAESAIAESTAEDTAAAAESAVQEEVLKEDPTASSEETTQEELTLESWNALVLTPLNSGITVELRDGTFIWWNNLEYLSYQWQIRDQQILENSMRSVLDDSEVEITHLMMYFPQEVLFSNSSTYYERLTNEMVEECLVPLGVAAVLIAISGLALMVYAGRKADGTLRLFWVDRIPTEFHAIALIITSFFVPALILQNVFGSFERFASYGNFMSFVYAMLYLDGLCIFALLLSLVRKLKGKCFWKGSVTYLFFRALGSFLGGNFLFRGKRYCVKSAYRIWWVAAVCGGIFILLGILGFYNDIGNMILILLALAFFGTAYLFNRHYRDMRDLDILLRQIENTADHQSVDVFLPERSPLKVYEEQLAHLSENINENVKQRMAAERMKLDLITNVSHDLKTPLTSIIGYVDLLNKMELSGEAGDYVKILQKKADRLSDTVSDLFTLAKSTSGSDELHLEPLDLVTAVNQVLADFADRIEASHMPIKTTMPSEAWVQADSSRIYRVLQNLLDNALRYSLQGTRIFLTVSKEQQSVSLTVLNTAGYEMNFSAQEIVQRFVRGDKSRTEEGSGLGLSIAESFMQNFGGDMKVSVEGDCFRVVCTFLPAGAPAKPSEPEEPDVTQETVRQPEHQED